MRMKWEKLIVKLGFMRKHEGHSETLFSLLRKHGLEEYILGDPKKNQQIDFNALLPQLLKQAEQRKELQSKMEVFTHLVGEGTPPSIEEAKERHQEWAKIEALSTYFDDLETELHFNYFAAVPHLVQRLSELDPDFKTGSEIESSSVESVESVDEAIEVTEEGRSDDDLPTETALAEDRQLIPLAKADLDKALEQISKIQELVNNDRKALLKWHTAFTPWKDLLLGITQKFDDELMFELYECLENSDCGLEKRKQVLTHPLNLENKKEENLELINRLKDQLNAFENKGSTMALLELGQVNVRTASNLDYSLITLDSRSVSILRQEKETLNSLLLVFRMLERGKSELPAMLVRLLQANLSLKEPIAEPNKGAILQSLLTGALESPEQQLAGMEAKLRDNTKLVNDAERAYIGLRDASIKFINRSLLNPYNQLGQIERNLENSETQPSDSWKNLLSDIQEKVFKVFLGSLKIIEIEVKRGDAFDYIIHNPMGKVEPDPELPKDTIKSIEGPGFHFIPEGHEPIILKPADVIVA